MHESQATRLIRLATEAGADFWHTPAGDAFVTLHVIDHDETHALRSRSAREWLARLYYRDVGAAPHATALQDAIGVLSGRAHYDGMQRDAWVRVAEQDGIIYLDLGDPTWQVVQITAAGWRLVSNAPVRFRRPRGMLPLPIPTRTGAIDQFRSLLNVASGDDFILIISWLLGALRSRGPFPVLSLEGEQGSAKSTTAKLLRRLIDPNTADLRSEPREPRDLIIAATNSHLVALDNVSRLPDWLSDALCRLSTGGVQYADPLHGH